MILMVMARKMSSLRRSNGGRSVLPLSCPVLFFVFRFLLLLTKASLLVVGVKMRL